MLTLSWILLLFTTVEIQAQLMTVDQVVQPMTVPVPMMEVGVIVDVPVETNLDIFTIKGN